MYRVVENPDRALSLLNGYAFFVVLLAATGGFGFPWISVVVGPLLVLLPIIVLLFCLLNVSPKSHPSRDDQVMWLVGVTTLGALLISGASGTVAPNLTISLVDRVVFALGVGIVEWILLAIVRVTYDASGIGRQRFLKPWHCRGCGYDLRGAASNICPECQTAVHCRRCGGSFTAVNDDSCMHCGTPRAANPYEEFDDDDE